MLSLFRLIASSLKTSSSNSESALKVWDFSYSDRLSGSPLPDDENGYMRFPVELTGRRGIAEVFCATLVYQLVIHFAAEEQPWRVDQHKIERADLSVHLVVLNDPVHFDSSCGSLLPELREP